MFYSQKLEQPQTINFCVRCETKFERWCDYHAHVISLKCALKIKPTRTTKRVTGIDIHNWSKEGTIVGDWELKNKGALIK